VISTPGALDLPSPIKPHLHRRQQLMTLESTNELPSTTLKNEHQVILRTLVVLERLANRSDSGDGFEHEAFAKAVEFLKLFADACHHAKEEDLLFPALEARGIPREGGPIGVMLYEHTVSRGFVSEMGQALEAHATGDTGAADRFVAAARSYISLLRDHINKEDNVLYMIGDNVMTEDDQATLCSKFCEVGCKTFGGKKREELERIADELETAWPG
jgi:hemerythrin-like domain-containing protein